ncbi:uncharacterized protein N7511_004197 [Penicillium nucicola]|uniref:uncharacterized protein n=1 Tax=Penicillium nucicola TaxID=1850975 RepID=UPI00254534FB|nr:uncharacterized protein N7511_004197 [Penicillium nucicola]KAJ5766581.1 hypothetical protein N7511_004197 [Penicillium nucicola]
MEPRNDSTTTQTYYQKPRFSSAESRTSSPARSQDTTVFGDYNVHDSPRSRSFPAGNDHHDLNTKPKSPSKCGGWTSLEDTWILECFALGFSFASFIAVIIILKAYDQKPSPHLSYGLTLNTIISLLATSSRSSLLFVVAGAIGQLKWVWFGRREQPILDMQSFDDASRGPLGAMYLLFQHRGLSIASLGAIVTILSMALDPFVQQILSYPVQQTPGSTTQAWMPQALTFAPNANFTAYTQYYNAALWNSDFAVNPTCPSGNCTWPEFQSLGFCSKCQDVTNSSTILKCDKWTQPDGDDDVAVDYAEMYYCQVNIGHGSKGIIKLEHYSKKGVILLPTGLIWKLQGGSEKLNSFLGVPWPMYAFAHAQLDVESANANITELVRNIRLKSVQACALSFCLRTYNVSVSSGTPQVNVTAVDFGQRFGSNISDNPPDIGYDDIDCWGPTNRSAPLNLVRFLTGNWGDTEQFVFCLRTIIINSGYYPGSGFGALNNLYGNSPFLGYSWTWYGFDNTTLSWFHNPTYNVGNTAQFPAAFDRVINYGLGPLMSDTAAALTKYTLQTSTTSADGTAMISQAFVRVSWQWLTFPSVLLVAGFVFWITTMMKNRQHRLGLWKSSILPMLYCGAEKIDPRLERPGSSAEYTTISQMSQSAQVTRVKMEDIIDGRLRLGRNKWSEPPVF